MKFACFRQLDVNRYNQKHKNEMGSYKTIKISGRMAYCVNKAL